MPFHTTHRAAQCGKCSEEAQVHNPCRAFPIGSSRTAILERILLDRREPARSRADHSPCEQTSYASEKQTRLLRPPPSQDRQEERPTASCRAAYDNSRY